MSTATPRASRIPAIAGTLLVFLVPMDTVIVLAEYSHPFKDSSFKMNSPFGLFAPISGFLTGWHYSARCPGRKYSSAKVSAEPDE